MNTIKATSKQSDVFSKIYSWMRTLSLDVTIGAAGGGIMAARILDLPMNWAWYICLPLSVWLIYTLDHLMDAHRLGDAAHTERHLYHHKHFWPLMGVWLILAPICLICALIGLPVEGVYFGLGMFGLVAGHLLLVKFIGDTTAPWLMKELGVGLIYALGVWGLPLLIKGQGVHLEHIFYVLQFWMLAMVNLLEFSIFEYKTDELDGHTSFVRAIGPEKATRAVWVLLILSLLLGASTLILGGSHAVKPQMVYGIMALLLGWIMVDKKRFGQREMYRAVGDAAFLVPYLFLVL